MSTLTQDQETQWHIPIIDAPPPTGEPVVVPCPRGCGEPWTPVKGPRHRASKGNNA